MDKFQDNSRRHQISYDIVSEIKESEVKSSQQNHTKQVKLFFESPILSSKPTVSLFPLPEDTQPRRINHMAKFKPFHEFQKPLIGFTPESFPHLHEDKFRLYRNGTTQRPSLQGSQTCPRENGERLYFH